jgi:hypothetical protein
MKFIKNKTKALAMCLSVVALAGVTNAFCVNEANAIIVNDEITNAAVRTTTLDAMIPYKEDGYDNAQTWLVDKCNMKDSQFDDVIYIIQNYGDYLEQNDILEIQDIMEKQSVCDTITELKQYKARLDSWKQYGADKKQKALQEKKEAEERAAQEAAAQKAAAQVSYQNQQSNSYSTSSYSYSGYSWNGSARDFIVSKESGGSYSATNGRYYGAYQLDISYLNGDLSQENQDRVAEQYVSNRYGSWENAAAHWQSHGWY